MSSLVSLYGLRIVVLILVGYFIGSIPSAFIVGKIYGGIDIRKHGSGNTGATNVFRTLGKKAAVIAFLGDFFKGILAVYVGRIIFNGVEFVDSAALLCGFMSIMGHCYSLWINFKGGKGVATSVGVIMAVSPIIAILLLLLQFVMVYLTRIMSLASIVSSISYPLLVYAFGYGEDYLAFSSGLAIFVIFKHRSNIVRLIKGKEKKLKNIK